MTALAHGIPVVTTRGKATEVCWVESGAVKLTNVGDISGLVAVAKSLLADPRERRRLSAAAKVLYYEHFDIKQTIMALREVVV
jgi:glycosyltransferase involved in cell wall biosynthesis